MRGSGNRTQGLYEKEGTIISLMETRNTITGGSGGGGGGRTKLDGIGGWEHPAKNWTGVCRAKEKKLTQCICVRVPYFGAPYTSVFLHTKTKGCKKKRGKSRGGEYSVVWKSIRRRRVRIGYVSEVKRVKW